MFKTLITLMRYLNKHLILNVFINYFLNLNCKHNKHLRKINQYLSLYNIIKIIVFFLYIYNINI